MNLGNASSNERKANRSDEIKFSSLTIKDF
jgi:hypothetical protein